MQPGVQIEKTDFSQVVAGQIKSGEYLYGFDINNGGRLSKMDSALALTVIERTTIGLFDYRGQYDASGNTYPATGGSGSTGSILQGDIWRISVGGTLPVAQVVEVGDMIMAITDTPGQTQANWEIIQANIGYIPENSANKDVSGGYVGLTLLKINFLNVLGTFTSFFTNSNTAARTYTFQDSSDTMVGRATVDTLTNKSIVARIQSVTSAATVTPNADANDEVVVTALAVASQFLNPTGTPTQGQVILIRVKDNGTGRALTYDTQYRAIGITLPTTTVANKTTYIGMVYNSTDTKWDCISTVTEA